MRPSPTYHPPHGEECETSVEHGLPLWAETTVGYCSWRPHSSTMWGNRFVGAREVGPSVGEQKPLRKTPLGGNPSPEMTYLPTLLFRVSCTRTSPPACMRYKPMWTLAHGHTGPAGSHRGARRVHSCSCSSPSHWPSTYNAPTPTWHHTPYGPRYLLLQMTWRWLPSPPRQPLPDAPNDTRANHIRHDVTSYLQNSRPLVHNVESTTMVHNVPPPPLRPGDPSITPMGTATYLVIGQAVSSEEITPPPYLERQLARTLVIARIVALSTQALAYFLRAVLIAAIGFQALHLTHPKHMLRGAVTLVGLAWAVQGHRPTSLPTEVHDTLAPYYGDVTHHLVQNAYDANTAAHLHRLPHNQQLEVREVFTPTSHNTQHQHNTCPQ